ncbi:MAG: ABC transporter ATP-binding protein [Conexibacter sp.]
MAGIAIEGVSKTYPDGTTAVAGVDLEIADGSFTVLVGPSGCGKTTLLRMIAGLEPISGGTLRIGGDVVNTVPPQDRDVAMVFQSYALYPHMTVARNMAYGLRQRRVPKAEIEACVRRAARTLDLEPLLHRKPAALSGGQRQRVAMGRAIVREPQAFLMDEPLSNLDAKLRTQMRAEIAQLQQRLGTTTVYVTHDQVEAMTLGDRVAVMRDGVLLQCAEPQELYERPSSVFVAGFMGSPPMNVFAATLQRGERGLRIAFGGETLDVPDAAVARHPGLAALVDRRVAVGIRPEDVAVREGAAPPGRVLTLPLRLHEVLGRGVDLHFALEGAALPDGGSGLPEREELHAGEAPLLVRAEAGRVADVAVGDPVSLEVAVERLRFFDAASGRTLAES